MGPLGHVRGQPALEVTIADASDLFKKEDAQTTLKVPPEAQRPPTLKPEAANKLLDIADQLDAALRLTTGADTNVATLAVTAAPAGNS